MDFTYWIYNEIIPLGLNNCIRNNTPFIPLTFHSMLLNIVIFNHFLANTIWISSFFFMIHTSLFRTPYICNSRLCFLYLINSFRGKQCRLRTEVNSQILEVRQRVIRKKQWINLFHLCKQQPLKIALNKLLAQKVFFCVSEKA